MRDVKMRKTFCVALTFFLLPTAYSIAQDGIGRSDHQSLSRSLQLAQSGQFDEAISNLQEVRTLRSYNLQSTLLHAIGETSKAIPLLEESHKHFPRDLATLRNLIVLHFFVDSRDESRKYAKKLFSITLRAGESFEIQRIACILDDDVADTDRVERLFSLHEKFPNEAWTLDFLAKLLVRRRDRERLGDVLERQAQESIGTEIFSLVRIESRRMVRRWSRRSLRLTRSLGAQSNVWRFVRV